MAAGALRRCHWTKRPARTAATLLRDKGFGYVQNSVWITPDPLAEERQILGGGKINVESLLLLEARPCAGESDAEIVAGAWDFERINRRYARHLKILGERPGGALRNAATAKTLLRWAAAEREAWLEAGDERSAAAGPDSAVRLPGATGVAAAGGSAPGRQPATTHVQTRIAICKLCCICNKRLQPVGGLLQINQRSLLRRFE